MTRVLVVDNYDSFVYNLVQYLGQLGAEVDRAAQRRGRARPSSTRSASTACCSPPARARREDAGASMAFVTACAERALPLFGVCLGHQAIGAVFGAPVVRAPELLHGKTSDGRPRRDRACSPGCRRRSSRRATTRSPVEADALPPEIVVTGAHRVRRRDGAAAREPADRRACSSTRSRC